MAANEIHVGDVGTLFKRQILEGTMVVNLSGATVRRFIFAKPDGTVVTRNAEFTTDGTDGWLQYASQADDLDQAGKWRLQVFVAIPGGAWHSDVANFVVVGNLDQ